jgi:uncharacterized protein (TIGR02677 family)
MEVEIMQRSLKSVPELKYVNAENVARYRAIMRFVYGEYKKLRYWMRPEDVYAGITAWNVLPEYTLEQCGNDLEQLVEWGNLTSRHDGGRSSTLEEYMRKKMQYFLRPYSIEIERLLEALEKVTGYGGSLEPTLFESIAEKLQDIRSKTLDIEPQQAVELWSGLYEAFVKLHENAADYIASLQTARAGEMMVTNSFLIFKEQLTNYLQNFVQALQRSAYKIEGNLQQISENLSDMFLDKVVEGEMAKPRLEEGLTREELLIDYHQGWGNLQRWFLGHRMEPSELTLLERATKEAIARIVRSVIRIQERKRSGISRRKELEHLAKWFAEMADLEEAHKLSAFAFGLFPTRHLQGEDLRESDRADMSMWDERPAIKLLRSRSRKRAERHETQAIPENEANKQREREAFFLRQAEELEAIKELTAQGKLTISELGTVSSKNRLRLLYWIGRSSSAVPSYSFMTPEGLKITITNILTKKQTMLVSEDGELYLPDYELVFTVNEAVNRQTAPESKVMLTMPASVEA